ncbi:hypothetical protein OC845_000188 [Tilletia horrida]|nr:hypothetical protein OC845_000188 [Tilletia horrida]
MPASSESPIASGSPSDKSRRSEDEEHIPLPELRPRSSLTEKHDLGDDEDEDEDDLIVHESQGLLGNEGEDSTYSNGHEGGIHLPGSPTSASRKGSHSSSKGTYRSLAINRAVRERNAWLYRHKYYRPLRLGFFLALGIGAITLAIFALRSVLHVSSSHAPGSVSSSSHPPSDEHLLASTLHSNATLTNGTHEWRHTVIFISLDGVKPDYVRNYKLKNVARIGLGDELFDAKPTEPEDDEEEDVHDGAIIPGGIAVNHTEPLSDSNTGNGGGNGGLTGPLPGLDGAGLPSRPVPGMGTPFTVPIGNLLASSMLPIFPTLTFPNHWSLLTGLYASSHGIVANEFHIQPKPKKSETKIGKNGAAAAAAAATSPEWNIDANLAPGREFYYSDPARSWFSSWWLGQPIWATAERAGIPTAVHMWPGPPATSDGDRPRYFRKYEEGPNWDGKPERRVEDVLEWLGKPDVSTPASAGLGSAATNSKADVRPQLICLYFPDVDKAAHKHGPDSNEVDAALASVDVALGRLRAGIHKLNATGLVDLVVVSDHGMAATSAPGTDRVVYLDKVLGKDLWNQIESIDGYPSRGIRFKPPSKAGAGAFLGIFGGASQEDADRAERALYERAKVKLEKKRDELTRASLGWSGPFHVYWKEDLPKEWHLNDDGRMDSRLAPLWVVPTEGWGFTDEKEMKGWGGIFKPKGNHGYPLFDPFSDHPDPLALRRSMHAIFAASGPSFARSQANPAVKLTHHTTDHVGWNMPVLGALPPGATVPEGGGGEGNGAASPAQGLGAVGTGGGKGRVDGAGTGAALRNLEVYDLICRVLGVPAAGRAAHNGTAGFWDQYVDRP